VYRLLEVQFDGILATGLITVGSYGTRRAVIIMERLIDSFIGGLISSSETKTLLELRYTL
jgi:hypothetical protein